MLLAGMTFMTVGNDISLGWRMALMAVQAGYFRFMGGPVSIILIDNFAMAFGAIIYC